MQPLASSMMSRSLPSAPSRAMALSMPSPFPNSFSITAIRRPCGCVRMKLRSVLLPAPRKPVMMVTGTAAAPPGAALLVLGALVVAVGDAGAAAPPPEAASGAWGTGTRSGIEPSSSLPESPMARVFLCIVWRREVLVGSLEV